MSILELKKKLSDYYTGKLDRQINDLREEILHPAQPVDEQQLKVSGNRISRPTEDKVISLMQSYPLINLERRKACIETFLDHQSSEDRQILEYIYKRKYSRIKISCELYMTRKTIYNRERMLIVELGKYLAFEI